MSLKRTGQLFKIVSRLPGTSSGLDIDDVFWQEYPRRMLFLVSAPYKEVHDVSSSVCGGNFDQLVKEISARLKPLESYYYYFLIYFY